MRNRELWQRVGLLIWPHGLRHTSITTALKAGKSDIGREQVKAHAHQQRGRR